MGWQVGYDDNWRRWVGYGVPAICDHPGCGADIDRGLAHVCGDDVYGGEHGCGLFFCGDHFSRHHGLLDMPANLCERCVAGHKANDDHASFEPFDPTPDTREWVDWMLTDESWAEWRAENPEEVHRLQRAGS